MEMEQAPRLSGSPPGATPLQPVSPDRINQQREGSPLLSNRKEQRDREVHDKIRQFNNLAQPENFNTMSTSKLERKTADAALKRAILGREEAEGEMRRYRDEARSLRKQIEEARERERRVGERLETVMVGTPFHNASQIFPVTTMLSTVTDWKFIGKLRTGQGNAFPHTGTVGEGNPTSA